MEDLQIVEIKNHWFVGIEEKYLFDENLREIIGYGKTKEEAIDDAKNYLSDCCKELDEALNNIAVCLNKNYHEIKGFDKTAELEDPEYALNNLNNYRKILEKALMDISGFLNVPCHDIEMPEKTAELEGVSIESNGNTRTKFSAIYFRKEDNCWGPAFQ